MKLYQVGGSVRDELLGRPSPDRDWVAVGTTAEALLAQGYISVGKDFPVFLHPDTREEVALARTERKTAPGYRGFQCHASPEVTLEEDLQRRDLTINAMAKDEQGQLIDPFGGQRDLEARVFRHVSPAFAEDPVRILRLARFSARFADFDIAPATLTLMRNMVQAGEVDALVPERVWQEMARGLMEIRPSRMLDVLHACGALSRLLPHIDVDLLVETTTFQAVDLAATRGAPLTVRFAVLWMSMPDHQVGAVSAHLHATKRCRDLALLAVREHRDIVSTNNVDAACAVRLLERCDALRHPERFVELLDTCAARFGTLSTRQSWLQARDIIRGVNVGAIAQQHANEPAVLRQVIQTARISALEKHWKHGLI